MHFFYVFSTWTSKNLIAVRMKKQQKKKNGSKRTRSSQFCNIFLSKLSRTKVCERSELRKNSSDFSNLPLKKRVFLLQLFCHPLLQTSAHFLDANL